MAHAWTEAEVEGAEVHLELDEGQRARVSVTLRLHVRGGWLEQLEVAGLDAFLSLDETTVRVQSSEGREYRVDTVAGEGVIRFDFRRRRSPRRGDYLVFFEYNADLSGAATRVEDESRLSWTLPGWESGLDGVEVSITGPDSLEFIGDQDETIVTERSEVAGRATLTWRRPHIPRTVPWRLTFVTERHFFDTPPDETQMSGEVMEGPAEASWSLSLEALPIAALLSAVALLLFAAKSRRHRAIPLPLFPASPPVRALLLVFLSIAAVFLSPAEKPLSLEGQWAQDWPAVVMLLLLLLFALERTPARLLPGRLGSWRRLAVNEELPIAHRPWDSLFDLSRPVGFLVALAALTTVSVTTGHLEVLLLVPWLTATRLRLPPSLRQKRSYLLSLADRLPLGPYAVCLSVHEDTMGRPQDVRLRVVTRARMNGLIRLDIVVQEMVSFSGVICDGLVLVVAREQSDAAMLAEERFGPGQELAGGRLAWTAPLSDVSRCAHRFGQHTQRSVKMAQNKARREDTAVVARA